jgi:adenosylcobinamide-GDP ribazoletransferase
MLPVPGRDAERMSSALPWFPLVGFIIGLILYGLARLILILSGQWAGGAAISAVIAGIVLTRGVHLDGLADWADGFWGARSKDHILRIMKDPHKGTFGVTAIAAVLLTKWVAFLQLLLSGSFHLVLAVYIIARTSMVLLAIALPYAREEGGTGLPFVLGGTRLQGVLAVGLALALLSVFHGLVGALLFIGGLMGAVPLGMWFHRRVGGVTGDLLGACCEIMEAGLILLCAVGSEWLLSLPDWRILIL